MNKETREEYLETLYKLSIKNKGGRNIRTNEIAEMLNVSPSTVTEVLPILEKDGYAEYLPYYGVKLTEKGRELGKRIVRTHRLIEVFLNRFFTIDKKKLHKKACQLEHVFDLDMINEMCRRMGAPKRCPHGRKIPFCEIKKCPLDSDK